MEVNLAILRGINVSGQKKIQMAGLKELFEEAGFKKVVTYIQSGNVVFENHHVLSAELPKFIEQKIKERYNFDVPVITRTVAEMGNLINQNPLLEDESLDQDKLHVTFLAELPAPEHLVKIEPTLYNPDKFRIQGKEVFLFCPNGYGNTKLNNTFLERKLKVTATTRNWRTVNELFRIMKAYEPAG
jgi:uncharacterized protein (DUF1697 family)